MSDHLTSEQISKCMIGDCTDGEQQHARECPECGAELSRFQNAVLLFRSSVWLWADRQRGSNAPGHAGLVGATRPLRPLRWVPIAAAVAVVAIAPIYKNSIDRQHAAQATQDAQLLDKVNDHLSRTAPASLEPLMDLLSHGKDPIHEK